MLAGRVWLREHHAHVMQLTALSQNSMHRVKPGGLLAKKFELVVFKVGNLCVGARRVRGSGVGGWGLGFWRLRFGVWGMGV